jgi:drug/metabolite transporter (DMT)-like permease
MLDIRSPNFKAALQALLVTFLWSTSWVLIKFGLKDIPALTFAGLRYSLAFLCLLPLTIHSGQLGALRGVSRGAWARLLALGVLFYAVTQGAQFLSLVYLPAVTTSLLLGFTAVVVALLGIPLLSERPTSLQWVGTALSVAGVIGFLYPVQLRGNEALGIALAGVGVLANALSSILGRDVNRRRDLASLSVTAVSMGAGAAVLLTSGILTQGVPRLSLTHWAIIVWLALVNSAFAFTLWNRTLRTLSAMESSIINNTMLFQIALLAWVFLGEQLSGRQVLAMMVAGLGTLLVQVHGRERSD